VFVVTESSAGPIKRFREMNVAHVGVHGDLIPTIGGSGHNISGLFGKPGKAFRKARKSTGVPVLLFWYQDFSGATGQIQVFI